MYWHLILQLLIALWKWSIDQKIQALILIVLLFTMSFEIPKIRKRILFLKADIHSVNFFSPKIVGTRVQVRFSNHCRRVIKGIRVYSFRAKVTVLARSMFPASALHEGDTDTTSGDFSIAVPLNEIRKITLRDSVNKSYTGYLYNGEFRNRWITYLLRFRDLFSRPV